MDESLYGERLPALRADMVISCGDLPFDYLEYLVSRLDVPLLFVPGNHDPSLKKPDMTWMPLYMEPPAPGPQGCENIDGRIVEACGLRVAGLGGSLRYKAGPNQYTQAQMTRRALLVEVRARLMRARDAHRIDILVTHAPPFGFGVASDAAHVGFVAFQRLVKAFHPLLHVHGHVHPYGRVIAERRIGATRVVNAVPSCMIDL